ncbi:MAG: ABC transporter permease [Firmicutes bacterium]|nr:ABC transporter permease [Bacillota bacterium]
MKSLLIAWSNIKKRKSSAATLVILSLLATLMLVISLSLLTGVGALFDTRAEELNAPHVVFSINANDWNDGIEDIVYGAENLKHLEVNRIMLGEIRYILNNRSVRQPMSFAVMPENAALNTVTVLNRLSTTPQNPIILPLIYRINGFSSGDIFLVNSAGSEYSFTIYGFFENVFFNTNNMSKAFVCENMLAVLEQDTSLFPAYMASMLFYDDIAGYDFFFGELLAADEGSMLHGSTLSNIRLNATSFSVIMAAILSLVALIIVVVSLIVARFNIINSLDQDMKTIGALKGIGMTSPQLMRATILQYLLIVVLGVLIGLIISFPMIGIVGNLVSATSGLLWSGMSMTLPSIISVFSVVGAMMLATFLVSRRTKKITPIKALRSGLENHSFKKSATKLETSKMPLNISMALKQFKTNFRRNIAAFITLTLFGFMIVLGFTMHHNFVTDTSAYLAMIGVEPAHVRIMSFSDEFVQDHFDNIGERENVRGTLRFEFNTLHMPQGQQLRFTVWEDIARREVNPIIRGRQPAASNEISITAQTSNWINLGIGDTLTLIHQNGEAASFLIAGIIQGWGSHGFMTQEGFNRLDENIVLRNMYIYLHDNSYQAISDFMSRLSIDFGRELVMLNQSELMDEFFAAMEQPINIAMLFIIFLTILVVVLVFFLMVNTIINRNKKEAGILKAMGFTSKQLILHNLFSFLPIILGAVALGTILGVLLTNPLLGIMFGGMGIAQAAFTIVPWTIAAGAVSLMFTCVITILLVSLKYKHITARSLIIDG